MGTRRTKAAARCEACGRILAVWLSEGDVIPIGTGEGCHCGGSSFQVVN